MCVYELVCVCFRLCVFGFLVSVCVFLVSVCVLCLLCSFVFAQKFCSFALNLFVYFASR